MAVLSSERPGLSILTIGETYTEVCCLTPYDWHIAFRIVCVQKQLQQCMSQRSMKVAARWLFVPPALFQCNECNKVFRDTWFLKQHQRVHAEERQVFICPREGCQRSFTTPFNLQSHIGSFHEELRPYTCPHEGCGKTIAIKVWIPDHSPVVLLPDFPLYLVKISSCISGGAFECESGPHTF